jgi:hypothetical protein
MIIRPSDFENGGEVDFKANHRYRDKSGQLSMRLVKGRYELYLIVHGTKEEMILFDSPSIHNVVEIANGLTGFGDVVGDD